MHQREVILYTRGRSLLGWRARGLLKRQGYLFEVVDTTGNPALMAELVETVHHEVTLPYVLVDHRPVGSFGTLKSLSRSGEFEHLMRDRI